MLKNFFAHKTRPFEKPPDNKVPLSVLEYYLQALQILTRYISLKNAVLCL